MNIFILDYDVTKCARMHCDKHIVKMVLETAQILSTSLHSLGVSHRGYASTHVNHPCCVWARDLRHWVWLRSLGRALAAEYTIRYGKTHKSLAVINSLPIPEVTVADPKDWAIAVPAMFHIYKQDGPDTFCIDALETYRMFYRSKAERFPLVYTNRDTPAWLKEAA